MSSINLLKTIIINWHGPFRSVNEITADQGGNGLYMVWGKAGRQRIPRFQYIGITERQFCQRINEKGHICRTLKFADCEIWLGFVHYPANFDRSELELAEHCLSHYIEPDHNNTKFRQPRKPVCIISQWCTKEGSPRLRRPKMPHSIPDIMWWDLSRWRKGVMKVFEAFE